MSVWYCIPSKRPDGGTAALWRKMGYRVALFRDAGDPPVEADLVLVGEYPGYGAAVNALCREVLERDPTCEWVASGGDDVEPDMNQDPGLIAYQCGRYFGEKQGVYRMEPTLSAFGTNSARMPWSTFGVMQPTGDGHGIETICGSPWIGREFALRINQGAGPFWPEYTHNFVDNELQEVAKSLGVFWQRPDLTHKHNNWMWTTQVRPGFLDAAYSRPEWDKALKLFSARRSQGFPGHAPIEMEVAV